MTEKPRKPLSLKPKVASNAISDSTTQLTRRSKKRIIRRDELPASKLSTTKAPPKSKPKSKPKKKPQATDPKKPMISPSDIRLDNLNASLNGLAVWRQFKPLALGIEKQVFQYIAKYNLSSSKRVVQRLLRQHTKRDEYLLAITIGTKRFNLDGSIDQGISHAHREPANQELQKTQLEGQSNQ